MIVWDVERGTSIARLAVDAAIRDCAVVPDGSRIVAGDASGRVHFVDVQGLG